jgi:hypothetical protein
VRGNGWLQDDNRPTLALTLPEAGGKQGLTRILVGMHDHDSGLDLKSLRVVADFAVDGVKAGENLATRFRPASPGVWELRLAAPVVRLRRGKIEVSVQDRQGNTSRIERTFSVGP